ncbi:cryptococcal mannosyltransferase 1-domain-containing protein [Mycena capillaripes]|nr:cryptococcal mannosyltransferase 1-domain-containing protein [Mycena capillaripes]
MLDFAPGDARNARVRQPADRRPSATVKASWWTVSSMLHLPATIFRTTARLAVRYPLRCFAVVFGVWRLILLIALGLSFPPAYPESRALFVTTLLTVPLWGLCMCLFRLFWAFGTPIRQYLRGWRHRRAQYAQIGFEMHELDEDADEDPRPPHASDGIHKASSPKEWNWALIMVLLYLFLAISGLYMLATYEQPLDHRFKPAVELANSVHKRDGYGSGEKIFIAAMFYNNAAVIPYWTAEITKLIHYLGPDHVFVSVVESYSSDATPALLHDFDAALEAMGVPRRILTQDTSIPRPATMDTAPPRIEYLATVRNLVIEPLVTLGGYDRILFSNDVFVEAESIVELLNTRDGNYDMACGMDFGSWGLYDLWVLRDRLGRLVSALWPYFLEDLGFRGVMADEPAPVFACWNGITSIRAEPFFPASLRTGRLSTSPRTRPLPQSHPLYTSAANTTPADAPPLRFRASAPGECFSSESFNLPYDLRRVFALEDMYVNPRVITAYAWRYYVWFKYVTRHWAVKWYIEKVENGNGIHRAKIVLGNPAEIWQWEGAECHPVGFACIPCCRSGFYFNVQGPAPEKRKKRNRKRKERERV